MRTQFHSRVVGAVLVALEPIVFLACGVYAGTVYGGIVGALRSPLA
jgi:hypothetical protein